MRSSSLPMFLHELRQAARECRWLLIIAPLVAAFTLLVYHGVIPVRFDDRLGFLRNLLNFPWPILAWIVPYLILKTPDLQDPQAHWRTLPATKTQVFGSRLLLASVFTVVIPALMVAGAELAASSGHAWPQFLLMAAYQWAYLWIGAFAAFSLRGHRGVVLVVGMALVVFLVAIAVNRLPALQFTERGKFNAALLRMLPYWSLAAIGGPIFALWRIRRAGKRANLFVWLVVVGAYTPAVIVLENHLVLHPILRGERLPTFRAELIANPSGAPNGDTNYIAYSHAWRSDLTLPPECAGGRFERNARFIFENKEQYATGSWKSLRESGALDDFASNEAPYLQLFSGDQPDYVDSCWRRSPSDLIFSNLGETLGLPSDPEIWVPADKKQNEKSRWLRPSLELSRCTHSAYFCLPNPKTSGQRFETLKGNTIGIRAEVPLTYSAPTSVVFRVPMKDIRKTFFKKSPVVTPPQFSITNADATLDRLALILHKRIDAGTLGNAFGWEHATDAPQYAGLVVNRRLGQAVRIDGNVFTNGELDLSRATEFHCYFKFPRNFPPKDGDLPESWWEESEFVLLESEPGPQKILPLDIEIKASVPASAK